ncbi:MAG: putative S-layer protein [Candidatus Pacearchaeota archaeon]
MNKPMKLFLSIVFIVVFAQVAFAQGILSISNSPSSLSLYRSSNISSSFNLTNIGNETVTNITFNALNLPSGVSIIFNQSNIVLENGSSVIVGFTLSASSSAALGKKTVTINVTGENASTSFNFSLEVKKQFCEYGEKGTQLVLDVDKPENGDRFYAGENITIELNVENRGEEVDIVIEAELFDLTDNDAIDETSLEDTLDEDEDKDYTLNLKVPYDINPNHEYTVNVKVYEDGNEEEQCKEKSISIQIKKRTHSLVIEKKTFTSPIACNAPLGLSLKVANAGKNDEDVIVKVYNTEINFSSEQRKSIDEGESENFFFQDVLPVVAPGKYIFEIRVFSDTISIYDSIEVELRDNCRTILKDVSIVTESVTAYIGQDVTIKVTIANTGNVKTNYSILVSDYESWASIIGIEPSSLELEPGSQGNFFITLKPKENASLANTFRITVVFDSVSKSQEIEVRVQRETRPASAWQQFLFELQRNLALFVLIFVLAIIIIILIVLLARKTKARKALPQTLKVAKKR